MINEAFCTELNKVIDVDTAHDLYFDENSLYFYMRQLNFCCPDPICRRVLFSVNVYKQDGYKKSPHFRIEKELGHVDGCEYKTDMLRTDSNNSNRKNIEDYKRVRIPQVLILDIRKSIVADDYRTANMLGKKEIIDSPSINIETQNKGVVCTTSFQSIVNSFIKLRTEDKAKGIFLSIEGVKKTYSTYFKKIEFFKDGEKFIFYGDAKLKKYGENYSIKFNRWVDEKYILIYITSDIIQKFYNKKQFILDANNLLGKTIECFFIGSYPLLEIGSKGEKSWEYYNVNINNLKYISIREKLAK